MVQQKQELSFDSIMKPNVLKLFKDNCKDLIDDYFKLHELAKKIRHYLNSKIPSVDIEPTDSKEFYSLLLHERATDHFTSAMILLSQGYTVDALSITRSALEDLLVLINFHVDPDYFNKWYCDDKDFKVIPRELKKTAKKHTMAHKAENKFFYDVYSQLSDISHPRQNSINVMMRSVASIYQSNSYELEDKTLVVMLSFNAYQMLLLNFLEGIYPQDKDWLDNMRESIHGKLNISEYPEDNINRFTKEW